MPAKSLAVLVFAGLFGIVFIVFGIRRMFEATKGKGVFDSILWGSIGIAIGLGFIYGVYWFMSPSTDDQTPMPFEMHSHP